MDKTIVNDKTVHHSDAVSWFSLRLFRKMRNMFIPTSSDPSPTLPKICEERLDLLSEIHRTASSLEEIEQLLIRRIAVEQTTNRTTDQLICQLQIETNRLKAQVDELIQD